VLSLLLGVECLVTLLDQPFEQPVEHALADGTDGVGDLVLVTTLGDELVTDLDAGLQQVLVQISGVAAKKLGDALTFLLIEEKLRGCNWIFRRLLCRFQRILLKNQLIKGFVANLRLCRRLQPALRDLFA